MKPRLGGAVALLVLGLFAVSTALSDEPRKLLLVKLAVGKGITLQYLNQNQQQSKSVFVCGPSKESAFDAMTKPEMGGMILLPGSTVILKNFVGAVYSNGQPQIGDFIQIECAVS